MHLVFEMFSSLKTTLIMCTGSIHFYGSNKKNNIVDLRLSNTN